LSSCGLSLDPPRKWFRIGVSKWGGWPLIWENGECLSRHDPEKKAIREMNLSQIPKVAATFDEKTLIGSAGLVPVMRLARRAGLETLVSKMLTIPGGRGCDPAAKVSSIVAGMLTGADSIDDLGVLREGAVHKVLPGVKAPSTLGTFLRAFTFGHVRQLGAVAATLLVKLAGLVALLPTVAADRDALTWLDLDDTMRETYGYAKQGVGYGYNKVKGLNALLAILSTPSGGPVIVGSRLRKGPVNSARGAGKCRAEALPQLTQGKGRGGSDSLAKFA